MSKARSAGSSALNGKRVFIVEDETLVAMLVEDLLEELGCKVTAILSRVSEAQEFLGHGADFEVALLDVDVAGEDVYPVAEVLDAKGIPFVFVTGYGPTGVKEEWRDRSVVQKPIQQSELAQALEAAFQRR